MGPTRSLSSQVGASSATGLSPQAVSFQPRVTGRGNPVHICTPDGKPVEFKNPTAHSRAPSTTSLTLPGSSKKIRVESVEGRAKRQAEEERKKAEEEARAKEKEEAERLEREQKERVERERLEAERKAKEEEERKAREEEERKIREAERIAREEEERKAQEEERKVQEEERKAREEEERKAQEEERLRLQKEKEEEEARERERLRLQKEEEDRAAREAQEAADRAAREEEERRRAEAEAEAEHAREAEVAALAAKAEAERQEAERKAQADVAAHVTKESPTIEDESHASTPSPPLSLPSKPIGGLSLKRPAPGHLDLSQATTIRDISAAPISAIASARIIEDIESFSYPEGIRSPAPELNVNAEKGRFRCVIIPFSRLKSVTDVSHKLRSTLLASVHGSLQRAARCCSGS